MKHTSQIQRVISEARFRNSIQSEKVNKWKDEKQKREFDEMYRVFLNEEAYKKKMEKIVKSTTDLHEQIRSKKLMKLEKQSHNWKLEEGEAEARLK